MNVSFGQLVEYPSFLGYSRPSKVLPRDKGDHLGRRTVCTRAVNIGNCIPKHRPRVTCQIPFNKRSALLIEYQVWRRKERKTNVKTTMGSLYPFGGKALFSFIPEGRYDQPHNPERESTSPASANRANRDRVPL